MRRKGRKKIEERDKGGERMKQTKHYIEEKGEKGRK